MSPAGASAASRFTRPMRTASRASPGRSHRRIPHPRQVAAAAATGEAALAAAVLLDDHLHVEAHQRAHVGGQRAVGRHHQHRLVTGGQPHVDFLDAGVLAPRLGVHGLQQRHLGGLVEARDRVVGRVAPRRRHRLPGPGLQRLALPGDGARRVGGAGQRRQQDVFGIGEAGLFAADGPHPTPRSTL
jgi:hypothetical protein